jgi:hypothetical protein
MSKAIDPGAVTEIAIMRLIASRWNLGTVMQISVTNLSCVAKFLARRQIKVSTRLPGDEKVSGKCV